MASIGIGNLDFSGNFQGPAAGSAKPMLQPEAYIDTVYSLGDVKLSQRIARSTNSSVTQQEIYGQKIEDSSEHSSTADSFAASNLAEDKKFELLSAYLDDEVTAEERALVNHWLASDPEMQRSYQKQLKLKQALKAFFS
ncbi:MAG: hypothetical protein AAFZ17_05475 [Cyanobacteria bacterium J06650_10]